MALPAVLTPTANWLAERQSAVRHRRFANRVRAAALLAAAVLVWEIGGRLSSPLAFAPISAVLPKTVSLFLDGPFASALLETLGPLAVGFTASLAIGNAVGLTMGLWPRWSGLFDPYITVLIVTPVAAFIPLTVVLFGLGFGARVAVVILFTVAYVAVNAAAGVRLVQPALIEMSRSFGYSGVSQFRKVILPSALPLIIAGVRISYPRALTGVLVSQLFLSADGFGLLMLTYASHLQTANLLATTLVFLGLAVLGGALIHVADRWTNRWLHVARE